jgi:hypothetical protein
MINRAVFHFLHASFFFFFFFFFFFSFFFFSFSFSLKRLPQPPRVESVSLGPGLDSFDRRRLLALPVDFFFFLSVLLLLARLVTNVGGSLLHSIGSAQEAGGRALGGSSERQVGDGGVEQSIGALSRASKEQQKGGEKHSRLFDWSKTSDMGAGAGCAGRTFQEAAQRVAGRVSLGNCFLAARKRNDCVAFR